MLREQNSVLLQANNTFVQRLCRICCQFNAVLPFSAGSPALVGVSLPPGVIQLTGHTPPGDEQEELAETLLRLLFGYAEGN